LSILARLLCRGVKTNTEVVGLHPHSNSNKPLVWQMVCYSQLGYAKDLTMGVLLNILLNIQHLCYLQVMQSKLKAKSKSWGFTPHPTKEDCSSYPPWMLQDTPNGVESPLCSLPNLLSLPKDASMHLRKLACHPWQDSRNLSIRPAATPRGGVFCYFWVNC